MSQDLARGLAEWLGEVRSVAPGLSLAALEAFLWVGSGSDSSDAVHTRMVAGAPLAKPTVTRALGLLRGRGSGGLTTGSRRWTGWRGGPIPTLRERLRIDCPGRGGRF
jgi:hypothetical protein